MMKKHKDLWKKHGSLIMLDGWTNGTNKSLINFLINCWPDTMFVKSIDALWYVTTDEK